MNKLLTLITLLAFVSCKNAGRNAHLLVKNDLNQSTKSKAKANKNAEKTSEDKQKNAASSEDSDEMYSYQGDEVTITAKRITKNDDSSMSSADCGDIEYSGTLEVIEEISKNKNNANAPQPGDANHDCSTATAEDKELCEALTIERIAQNIKDKNSSKVAPIEKIAPKGVTSNKQRALPRIVQKDEVASIGKIASKGVTSKNERALPVISKKEEVASIGKIAPQGVTSEIQRSLPSPVQNVSQEEQRENFLNTLSKIHAEIRNSKAKLDPACVDEIVEEITEELNEDCEESNDDCEYTEEDVEGTLSVEEIMKILGRDSLNKKTEQGANAGSSDDILQGHGAPKTGSGTGVVNTTNIEFN